jgi:hypothetical protein
MNERTLSQPSHWAEVISQITDKLTGKNISVTYEFDDLTIDIPSARGPGGRDIGGPIKRAVLASLSHPYYCP